MTDRKVERQKGTRQKGRHCRRSSRQVDMIDSEVERQTGRHDTQCDREADRQAWNT